MQNKLIEEHNKRIAELEMKRAHEFAEREERIQNFMSKMNDSVVKK